MNLAIPEGDSYDEMAGSLLAEISDLLFGDKKDWKTLERLQSALHPPKVPKHPIEDHGPTKGVKGPSGASESMFDVSPEIMEVIREATKRVRQNEQEASVTYPTSHPVTWTSSSTNYAYKVHREK